MVEQDQPWRKLVGQIFMGSEKFVMRMQALLDDKQGVKEIPRIQRYPGRPALARLFTDIPDGDKLIRNERIVEAHLTYGYTLKEIGDCLCVHYTTVSKVVTVPPFAIYSASSLSLACSRSQLFGAKSSEWYQRVPATKFPLGSI